MNLRIHLRQVEGKGKKIHFGFNFFYSISFQTPCTSEDLRQRGREAGGGCKVKVWGLDVSIAIPSAGIQERCCC